MNTYELIKKKRDGRELTRPEIDYLVNGFVAGEIPDYQMAAFLMAVYFTGMSPAESLALTLAMQGSGETVDLSAIKGFKVDKHSTGGVGDTTTLVLAPLVASCGGVVAKMTGRELGHTGGTVDKLESIPGMQTELSQEQFVAIANRVHVSLIAQTARLAPADKLIYALRNVTATVDSIPLIASSIMSKKLAAGADGIVLDVKTGAGAFMQDYPDALKLAQTMVAIGEQAGKKMVALISGMDQPLGYAVGNAIEVAEAIATLTGNGPQDLEALVLELGSRMLLLSGLAGSKSEALSILKAHITQKKGLQKFTELIEAQGGNPDVVNNPSLLPQPKTKLEILSETTGYVQQIDALEVGMAAKILGAGRRTKADLLDLSIGLVLKKKIGERVAAGEPLAAFHTDGDPQKIEEAKVKFLNAYRIGPEKVKPPPLFYACIANGQLEEF